MKMTQRRQRLGVLLSIGLALALVLTGALPAAVMAQGPDTGVQLFTKATVSEVVDGAEVPPPFTGQQLLETTGVLSEPTADATRYAILIGSNYWGSTFSGAEIPNLPPFTIELGYAEADATEMAGLLYYVNGFDVVIPLIGEAASRDNILATIDYVGSLAQRGDEVVFYYSGHGAQLVTEDGDVHQGIVSDEGDGNAVDFIWDNELKKAFRGYNTDRVVHIYDMCLAGGMGEVAKPGNLVLMATTVDGIAAEVGEEAGFPINHGLFTYFLLGAFSGAIPEADFVDHDGDPATPDLTVEEAFDFASMGISQLTPDIVPLLAWIFGPDIAAQWGTPVAVDWATKVDLKL